MIHFSHGDHMQWNDHQRGFIEYGMGVSLSPNASEEERQGYKDHRDHMISLLTSADSIHYLGY